MRHVRIVVIILFFVAAALVPLLNVRAREWVEVNFFTVSTKAKQVKYLQLAERHMGENEIYADYLRSAEEMAEVLVFLDGAEIGVAERFEEATRRHEEQLLEQTALDYEALAAARIENENIFKFMATKYQLTDADIDKHRAILGQHIVLVENQMGEKARLAEDGESRRGIMGQKGEKVRDLLNEAKKHQAAGLNVEGYDLVKKAKVIVTSVLSRQ